MAKECNTLFVEYMGRERKRGIIVVFTLDYGILFFVV